MNLAWYGHLKFKNAPLWIAIVAQLGPAFLEYLSRCRPIVGSNEWSVPQLKVLQECITPESFLGGRLVALFHARLNGTSPSLMSLIIGAVFFAFKF